MNFQDWKTSYEANPFEYGVSDCCLALADWGIARGFPDGASALRGTYSDEDGMYELIKEDYEDVVGVVDHCANLAGAPRVQQQVLGSIAVIGDTSNIYRQWGAIWDGVRWQIRLKNGFTGLIARPLRIWAV